MEAVCVKKNEIKDGQFARVHGMGVGGLSCAVSL